MPFAAVSADISIHTQDEYSSEANRLFIKK